MRIEMLEQYCIEDKYSKSNIGNKIREEVENLTVLKEAFRQELMYYVLATHYKAKQERIDQLVSLDTEAIVDELFILIIQLEGSTTIQSIAGSLGAFMGYDDVFDGIKVAADLIAIACKLDICDITSTDENLMVESCYSLEDETKDFISRTKYLPPMICKPKHIADNRTSCYLSKNDSVLLGKSRKHSMPLALDVLNIMNNVELCLDERVLNREEVAKDTDPLDKNGRRRSKGTLLMIKQDHERMVGASKEVYKDLVESGNSFYMGHKYDGRGRLYCLGYHVSYQGSEYKRAAISLAKKELVV